jgi:hypothetical protein
MIAGKTLPASISREHADYSDISKARTMTCHGMPVPPRAQGTAPHDA